VGGNIIWFYLNDHFFLKIMSPILPTKINDSLQVLNTLKPVYKVGEFLFLYLKTTPFFLFSI
jgi:hypothetical protein